MISLDNLGVTYKDGTVALQNIYVKFIQGQFTVLLGASGAGKSTLVNLILRFYDPESGTVSISSKYIDKYNLKNPFMPIKKTYK